MITGFEHIFLPLAQFNFSGGVGNIVAASLETKGLIDQAAILSDFKEQIEWIAAAAWLFSICMGLGAVAVFGNYKQGAYLLVGPPLFYYMVTTTIKTDGAKAIFGDRVVNGSVEEEKNLLKWVRTIGDGNETVDVSFFFGVYDSIVTEVVQKIVSVMLDTKNQADLRFVARETVLSQVMLKEPDDRELASLVLTYNVGTCGDLMANLQQEVSRNDLVKLRLRDNKDIDDITKKTMTQEWGQKNIAVEQELKRYLIGLKDIAQKEGVQIPYTSEDDQRLVSCEQIWDFTRAALLNYATQSLTKEFLLGTSGEASIPLQGAINDVKKWLDEGSGGKLDAQKVLAIFIYKNMLTKMTPAALQGQVFNRSPMNTAQFEAVFGGLGNSEAHGGYFKLKYFAASIPYIQGLLLYLLSIAFPFFAIFLVLPGKAPSFLVWCSLWAWVKSWDIGFALVHVGRDIFWHMMKHSVNINGSDVKWSSDPTSVIRFVFQNDPLFNQNTYWIIAAALTMMVPFVTAHLALGATGMVDMFKGSIDQVATRFGQTSEGNAGRRHEANISERMMEEAQARTQRMAAEQHSRDAGAMTMDGKKMPLQDLRKGAMFGAVSYNPETKTWALTDGVTDARSTETPLAGRLGVMTMQLGNRDQLEGGRESSVAKADEVASKNKEINKHAAELKGKISSSKDPAEKAKLQSELDTLKKQHGVAPEDPLILPESIPHSDRGMAQLNEGMDLKSDEAPLSMQRYASDQREMAELYRQYGRTNDAYRFEQRAAEIDGMISRGETMTKADYYKYEQSVSNNIQDRLVTESRRRQHRLKRAAGVSSMGAYLNARQSNAQNAQHFFDAMGNYNSLPFGKGALVNPMGSGIKVEGTGAPGTASMFSSPSGGRLSGAEGDADADD